MRPFASNKRAITLDLKTERGRLGEAVADLQIGTRGIIHHHAGETGVSRRRRPRRSEVGRRHELGLPLPQQGEGKAEFAVRSE